MHEMPKAEVMSLVDPLGMTEKQKLEVPAISKRSTACDSTYW